MYVFCILYAVRARTSLAHNLSSFLNSNYPVFLHRFHPIWSAGGSGLRSVIVIVSAVPLAQDRECYSFRTSQ